MTILHVTDFHFNQRWFDWLLHGAPPHDLLALTGDLLDLSHPTSQRNQIAWVSDWMRAYGRPMCVCSGNHDLEWDSSSERWRPAYWLRDLALPHVWTDGQRVTLDGLSLLNIGCTTRPKGSEADVWLVHAPPTRTRVSARTDGSDGGDPDLNSPLRRYAPRIVLTGHVHDPVDWRHDEGSTVILNPGRNADAPFPNHILVRFDRLSCQHIAAARAPFHASPSLSPATVEAESPATAAA